MADGSNKKPKRTNFFLEGFRQAEWSAWFVLYLIPSLLVCSALNTVIHWYILHDHRPPSDQPDLVAWMTSIPGIAWSLWMTFKKEHIRKRWLDLMRETYTGKRDCDP